jgi:hypothetical protein
VWTVGASGTSKGAVSRQEYIGVRIQFALMLCSLGVGCSNPTVEPGVRSLPKIGETAPQPPGRASPTRAEGSSMGDSSTTGATGSVLAPVADAEVSETEALGFVKKGGKPRSSMTAAGSSLAGWKGWGSGRRRA